jgi:hypothetical protein
MEKNTTMKTFVKSISLCMLFVFLASSVSFAMEKRENVRDFLDTSRQNLEEMKFALLSQTSTTANSLSQEIDANINVFKVLIDYIPYFNYLNYNKAQIQHYMSILQNKVREAIEQPKIKEAAYPLSLAQQEARLVLPHATVLSAEELTQKAIATGVLPRYDPRYVEGMQKALDQKRMQQRKVTLECTRYSSIESFIIANIQLEGIINALITQEKHNAILATICKRLFLCLGNLFENRMSIANSNPSDLKAIERFTTELRRVIDAVNDCLDALEELESQQPQGQKPQSGCDLL